MSPADAPAPVSTGKMGGWQGAKLLPTAVTIILGALLYVGLPLFVPVPDAKAFQGQPAPPKAPPPAAKEAPKPAAAPGAPAAPKEAAKPAPATSAAPIAAPAPPADAKAGKKAAPAKPPTKAEVEAAQAAAEKKAAADAEAKAKADAATKVKAEQEAKAKAEADLKAKAAAEEKRKADWLRGLHLFAIFVATIVGIILKPLPMGAVAMIGIGCTAFTGTLAIADSMSGFSDVVIWLIVLAFMISRGFIKTGLGARIAYNFMALLGKRTLGLSYGLAATDLVLAPAIPSNTARAGGIDLYEIATPDLGLAE